MVFESFSDKFILPLLAGVTQHKPREYGTALENDSDPRYLLASYLTGRSKSAEDLIDMAGKTLQAPLVAAGVELRDTPIIGEMLTNPEGKFDVGTQLGNKIRKPLARITDNKLVLEDFGQLFDEPSDALNPNTIAGLLGYGFQGASLANKFNIDKAYTTGADAIKLFSPLKGRLGNALAHGITGGILSAPSLYTETQDPLETLKETGIAAVGSGLLGALDNPQAMFKRKNQLLQKEIQDANIAKIQEETKQAFDLQQGQAEVNQQYRNKEVAQQVFPELTDKPVSNFMTRMQRRVDRYITEPLQEKMGQVSSLIQVLPELPKKISKKWDYITDMGSSQIAELSPSFGKMLEDSYNQKKLRYAEVNNPAALAPLEFFQKNIPADQLQQIKKHLANGNLDEVYSYLNKVEGGDGPLAAGLRQVRKNYDDIGEEKNIYGLLNQRLENYSPRYWKWDKVIKDNAFLEPYKIDLKKITENKTDTHYNELEDILRENLRRAKQQAPGGKLSIQSRNDIIAETIDRERLLSRGDKSRKLKDIPDELVKYLEDPLTSYKKYMESSIDSIGKAKLILDLQPEFQFNSDIAKIIEQQYGAGDTPAKQKLTQDVYSELTRSGKLNELKSENLLKVKQAETAKEEISKLQENLNNLKQDSSTTINELTEQINKHNEEINKLVAEKKIKPTEELKQKLAELRSNKKSLQSQQKSYLSAIADEEMNLRNKMAEHQFTIDNVTSLGEDVQNELGGLVQDRMRQEAYKTWMNNKGFLQDPSGEWVQFSDAGLVDFNNKKYVNAATTLQKLDEKSGKPTDVLALAKMLETVTSKSKSHKNWFTNALTDSFLGQLSTAVVNLGEIPKILYNNGGIRSAAQSIMTSAKKQGIDIRDLGFSTREGANQNIVTSPFNFTANLSRKINANTAWQDIQNGAKNFISNENKEKAAEFLDTWQPYFTKLEKIKGKFTKQDYFKQFVQDAALGNKESNLSKEAILKQVFKIEPRDIDKPLFLQEHGDNPLVGGLYFLKSYVLKASGELKKELKQIENNPRYNDKQKLFKKAAALTGTIGTVAGGQALIKSIVGEGFDAVTGSDQHDPRKEFGNYMAAAPLQFATGGLISSPYEMDNLFNEKTLGDPAGTLVNMFSPAAGVAKDVGLDIKDLLKMKQMGQFSLGELRTPYYFVPEVKQILKQKVRIPSREQFKENKKAYKKKKAKEKKAKEDPFLAALEALNPGGTGGSDTSSNPDDNPYGLDPLDTPYNDPYDELLY